MAEEEATSAAPPVATEADAADKSKDNGKKHKKREDEVPIEELYDLSKPIPRIEKPNKTEHDAKLNELNAQFEQLKKDKAKVQEKIEAAMTSGKNTEIGKAKEAILVLRKKKS